MISLLLLLLPSFLPSSSSENWVFKSFEAILSASRLPAPISGRGGKRGQESEGESEGEGERHYLECGHQISESTTLVLIVRTTYHVQYLHLLGFLCAPSDFHMATHFRISIFFSQQQPFLCYADGERQCRASFFSPLTLLLWWCVATIHSTCVLRSVPGLLLL